MTYGFSLVVRGHDATPENFTRIASHAETLQIDTLWCSAHIVLPPQVRSGYTMRPGIMHPEHWKERYWEPFTVISYLAANTTQLKFGTSIVVLPMHNPFEIAKQVAEVDQLTGGRFTFGLGVGWFEEEFDVLKQDFHNRGARTNEALDLLRALWGPDPVAFKGQYYEVENAYFGPKPIKCSGPPVWIAGHSEPALKRAARYGSAWHPVRPSLSFLSEATKKLARYVEAESRQPHSVEIAIKVPLIITDTLNSSDFPTCGRPTDIVTAIKRYQELGTQHFVFDLVPETLNCTLDTMDRFAQEIRPHLS